MINIRDLKLIEALVHIEEKNKKRGSMMKIGLRKERSLISKSSSRKILLNAMHYLKLT